MTDTKTVTPLLSKILNKYTNDIDNATDILSLNDYKSVVDIAKTDKHRFILKFDEALNGKSEAIYSLAENYATQILQYVRALEGSRVVQSRNLKQGLMPTWQNEFDERLDKFVKPGAINTADSMVAYLTNLHSEKNDIEKFATDEALKLETRRPDLGQLELNDKNLNEVLPLIELVNEILSFGISKTLAADTDLFNLLATTSYPFTMPYDKWMTQIDQILSWYKINLGELIELTDLDFPFFLNKNLSNTFLRAKTASTHFSSKLNNLLLEAPSEVNVLKNFNFSNKSIIELVESISSVKKFSEKLGLTQEEVTELLAYGEYTAIRSAALSNDASFSIKSYLKSDNKIVTIKDNDVVVLADSNNIEITSALTLPFLHRISQLVRLQKVLKLPFDQIDLIISPFLPIDTTNHTFSSKVLYAFGLLKRWGKNYNLNAYDISALIWQIPIYNIGNRISLYDKVFGSTNNVREALLLDKKRFDYTSYTDTITQKICIALRININQLIVIGRAIRKLDDAESDNFLLSDLQTISKIYRLAILPKIFGFNIIEGDGILKLLNSIEVKSAANIINATPYVNNQVKPDVVETLFIYEQLALWLKKNKINPVQLIQILGIENVNPGMTESLSNFIKKLKQQIIESQIKNKEFTELNLPDFDKNRIPLNSNWSNIFRELFDQYGNVNTPLIRSNNSYLSTTATQGITFWGWSNYSGVGGITRSNNRTKIITKHPMWLAANYSIFPSRPGTKFELIIYDFEFSKPVKFVLQSYSSGYNGSTRGRFIFSKKELNKTVYTLTTAFNHDRFSRVWIEGTDMVPNIDYISFSQIILTPQYDTHSSNEAENVVDDTINAHNIRDNPFNLIDIRKNKIEDKIIEQMVPIINTSSQQMHEAIYTNIGELFNCDKDLVPSLLYGAKVRIQDLLDLIFAVDITNLTIINDRNSNLVNCLYKIGKIFQAVQLTKLSKESLKNILTYPDWLEGEQKSNLTFNLSTIYYLTSFQGFLTNEKISEDKLLNYFLKANESTSSSDECIIMLTQLINWEVSHVKVALSNITGNRITNIKQFDWLLRIKRLVNTLNVSVEALLQIKGNVATGPTFVETKNFGNELMIDIDKKYPNSALLIN